MSQSSSNAQHTNTNTQSIPPPFGTFGFANYTYQPNPLLQNQPPTFTQQQQQSILNTYYTQATQPMLTNEILNQMAYQQNINQMFQQQRQQQQQQQSEEETQEIVAETQIDASSSKKGKKICKKVSWSEDEEELLAAMWIHISEDSCVGNSQKGLTFWQRLVTDYNKSALDQGFQQRNKDQINSKFTAMSNSVKSFIGYHTEALRNRGSGQDDLEVMEAARKMYKQCEKGGEFKHLKAWQVWKDKSRWRSYMGLDNNDETPTPGGADLGGDDIFADDTTPRPIGKRTSNKRKESSSASESAQSKSSAICGSLIEQFKKITKTKKDIAKSKKKTLNVQEKLAVLRARKENIAFLKTSTEGMSEVEAQWIENEKQRIREELGMI